MRWSTAALGPEPAAGAAAPRDLAVPRGGRMTDVMRTDDGPHSRRPRRDGSLEHMDTGVEAARPIVTSGRGADGVAGPPARMSFDLPHGYFLGDMPPLAPLGVTWQEEAGRTVRLETGDLQRTATALLSWAREEGVELRALEARSVTPEEAFSRSAQGREGWGRG